MPAFHHPYWRGRVTGDQAIRIAKITYEKYARLDLRSLSEAIKIEFKNKKPSELILSEADATSAEDFIRKNSEYIFDGPDNFRDENGIGYELTYKNGRFRIWAVGRNMIDESGGGDDISIRFEIPK